MSFRSILVAVRFAAVVGGMVLQSSPACATTMVRLTDEALTLGAGAIVTGRVTDVRTDRAQTGTLWTYVNIAVDTTVKGYVPAATVTVRELGGRVGDDELRIDGTPHYHVGEYVIAFLGQDGDGFLRTSQMALGKFSVVDDPETGERVAIRELHGEDVIVLGAARLQSPDPRDLHLAGPFIARLRDIVRGQPVPHLLQPLRSAAAPSPALDGTGKGYTLFDDARWFLPDSGTPVSYLIDQAGDATVGFNASQKAIAAAFAAWTNVADSPLVMESGGTTTATANSFCDGFSKIIFNDPFDEITDPSGCGGVLAISGYCASGPLKEFNGTPFREIVESDVIFNDGWSGCSVWRSKNVAEVATHELGHTIGLAHSADPSATMYAFAHFDGRGAGLGPDDEAGVRFLYPVAPSLQDTDGDGVTNADDDCPDVANAKQEDLDRDGVGDVCDNCAALANRDQLPSEACGRLAIQTLRITTGRRRGHDAITIRGRFDAAVAGGMWQVVGQGLAMTLGKTDGDVIAKVSVPAGNFAINRGGTNLSFADKTGAQLSGVTRVGLHSREGSTYRFALSAKNLDLERSRERELVLSLGVGDERYISASRCSTNRSATRVICHPKNR